MSMGDPIQVMNDLTCVKEIIQALTSEKQKELFEQFVPYMNNAFKGVRPTTPTTTYEPKSSTSKRPLGSPESPKRSKKDGKVFSYLGYLLTLVEPKKSSSDDDMPALVNTSTSHAFRYI
jgi:hypothetical protein